jgi:hypothetical protein
MPGRPQYLPESVIGKASQDFFASEVIGKFFSGCPARKIAEWPCHSASRQPQNDTLGWER